MRRALTRSQLKVRILRAASGLSQEDFEREVQVDNIAGIEHGLRQPSAGQLARIAEALGLSPDDGEEMLRDYEARVARNAGRAPGTRLAVGGAERRIEAVIDDFESRQPAGTDSSVVQAARDEARRSWERLKQLATIEEMTLVVRVAKEYQTWAMVELLGEESRKEGLESGRSLDLVRLAVTAAEGMRAAEGWAETVRAYARQNLEAAEDPGRRV